MRDWALYGLRSDLGFPTDEAIPVRRPVPADVQEYEVSPGRVFQLSKQEWGILVPRELLQNRPLIGGLVDRQYAQLNVLPEKLSLYTYSFDTTTAVISITYHHSITAQEIFSAEFGYYSASVSTLQDFINFTRTIDDIVMIRWGSINLEIGGRKYRQDSRRSLTIEEIAALYHAYNPTDTPGNKKEYETYIRGKYSDMLRKDKNLRTSIQTGRVSKSDCFEENPATIPARVNAYPGSGYQLLTRSRPEHRGACR
ncbi:MAG: hypothetical protein IPQ16_08025 [Geobacteraceae bacterium]|nr:hypothetical protein [Geobacteraceae bacterium]